MSKLNDYISKGKFPIKRTGISNQDWELKEYKRKELNIIYECSLCDCKILPEEQLNEYIDRAYLIERKRPDFLGKAQEPQLHYEVLGFICKKCNDEISEYDTLYYG